MNIRIIPLSTLAFLVLAGCGRKNAPAGAGPTAAASESGGAEASPRTIEITASDQMKFGTTSITAKPGEMLHVVLTNTGSQPKTIMAHNWVLLKSGSDPAAFSAAASTAKDTNFIPPGLRHEIIARIDLVGPHDSGEITFKAPEKPGDYPYLCSFPAHYAVGMHGILTVQ